MEIVCRSQNSDDAAEVASLVASVFTASEGEAEGTLIGRLARDLTAEQGDDVRGFVAIDGEQIVGSIFFSRLSFATDVEAFILAPVAIACAHQRKGIGQQLIRYGLEQMKQAGAAIAVTYGDPAYYCKTGFAPVGQDVIPPPLPLSMPEGWLAQSLDGGVVAPVSGPSSCVGGLNDPVYW